MTTETRSGSVAIRCDCPNCHIELIRRTKDQVEEEASLDGWKFDVATDKHLCNDCQSGKCPGDAVAEARFGTAQGIIPAPGPTKKGTTVVAPDGTELGVAANDAAAKGDPLVVALARPPDPGKVGGKKVEEGGFKIEDVIMVGGGGGNRDDGAPS